MDYKPLVTLLAIVNPLAIVPFFIHYTQGFTPEQRFFIGFAQWACENNRPEDMRVQAVTDPHSPGKYRVNGVVVNLPECSKAFACKPGAAMTAAKPCKVW